MTITIFEGPDCGGKTTLINTVKRTTRHYADKNLMLVNHGPYIGERDVATQYFSTMLCGYDRFNHLLMDRSWISESIYGPLMRGANRITIPQRRAFERFALGCSAITILCIPSYEACEREYLKRRAVEYLPDTEILRQVYDKFANIVPVMHEQSIPTFLYNYEREDSKTLYLSMIYEIRDSYHNDGPGVGLFDPGTTLIVGEQLSLVTAAASFPWMSWDPRGCVAWLSEQLESWGVNERELYWINALDERGHELPAGAWLDRLRPKQVVALGAIAHAWVKKHRSLLKNSQVYDYPHPQHWKRFHYNEPYALKEVFVK